MWRGSSALSLWLLVSAIGCVGTIEAVVEPAEDGPRPPAALPPTAGATGTSQMPKGDAPRAPAACRPIPARLVKLTVPQLRTTLAGLIPSARPGWDDVRSTVSNEGKTFSTQAVPFDMPEPHVASLFAALTSASEHAPADWLRGDDCLATRPWTEEFGRRLAPGVLTQAFRRPPSEDELARFAGFLQDELRTMPAEAALAQLARVVTLSPRFLYRSELGEPTADPGIRRLGPYELASALSYLLTDGPPDADLMAAARSGALASGSAIAEHVERLLALWDPNAGLGAFLRERYQYSGAQAAPKDAAHHPGYPELAGDLVQETDRFIEEILLRQRGSAGALLDAPFTFVNPRLARHYGIAAPASMGFARQSLATTTRRGLLAQGAWLSTFAGPVEGDAVKRGRFIRERILCETVPPPPPTVNAVPPPPDGKTTQRQRLARHREDPGCASCHALMDPLGLPFEIYDAVGAHRSTEAGLPIDPSGVLVTTQSAEPRPFADAAELSKQLAASDQPAQCLQTALRSFAFSQDIPMDCPLPGGLSAGTPVLDAFVRMLASPEISQRSVTP